MVKKRDIDIPELIFRIKEANTAYRSGEPLISDTEYDNLLDALKEMIDSDEFNKFRLTLFENPGKVRHPYSMGSLDKIKAYDDTASISKWVLKTIPNTDSKSDAIFVSSKIDGCSARLSYVDGHLIGASTRGDGEYGVDIFSKARLFAPNELRQPFTGEIRGEITLTKETLFELSAFNPKRAYKNLRNGTAGLLNGKDITDDEISFLRFFSYEIMGITGLSKPEQFDKLKKLGFETAIHKNFTDIFNESISYDGHGIDDAFLRIFNEFAETAPFDIDGLVVSDSNDHEVFENAKIPEKTVAIKFNQMTADTKLIDIAWNVSKGGRLSPVGVVESVELGGTCVSNVTLNNIRMINELGLTYGCTVTILKSGDVIPKIVGVRHDDPSNEIKIEFPTRCPSCGHELKYDEDPLYPMCTNKDCDDVVYSKMLHFIRQLGIKHVSLKTLRKFGIRNVNDLINLVPDDGLVKQKFCDDINTKMFGASRDTLLSAFDYDGVSSSIIDKMISHYGFECLTGHSFDELSEDKPYGVGDKFLLKFCDGWKEVNAYFENITSNSRYYGDSNGTSSKSGTVTNGALQGKGFVVTGALETMSRENFKKTVVSNGGVYQSSVSKKTNYLVCNDVSSATTKVKKAESLGVMVIDESKFLNMLKDGLDGFSIF